MKRDIFLFFIVLSLLLHALLFFCSGDPETLPPGRAAFRRTYRLSRPLSAKTDTGESPVLRDPRRGDPVISAEDGEKSPEDHTERKGGDEEGDTAAQDSFIPAEITGIDITYPYLSRRRGEEGDVIAEVLVGSDGRIIQVEIIQSSGYERLDRAVREGIEQSRARPALANGVPVQSRRLLGPFHFRLKE